MPANKNQHYVPRCHLKPFSHDGDGQAIRLFNLASSRVIDDAPVKNQCSKNYFYGKQLDVEKALGKLEGRYSDVVGRILLSPSALDDDDLNFLLDFTHLQFSRTESMVNSHIEMTDKLLAAVNDGNLGEQLEDSREQWESARDAVKMFTDTIGAVRDLSPVIVQRTGRTPFITSDDPATPVNRYYSQKRKDNGFGLVNSGLIFLLPLTPDFCFMAYDSDAYSLNGKRGFIVDASEPDVDIINSIQMISCSRNLYLPRCYDASGLSEEMDRVAPLRRQSRHSVQVLIPHKTKANIFVRAEPEEVAASRKKFIALSGEYPQPKNWPRLVSFRASGFGYSDGSAAGVIRKGQRETRNGGAYKKVYV